MTAQALAERRDHAVARGVTSAVPVFVDRARNAELWDVEGRRYIDFAAGIAVVNTGHGHPRIIEAVTAQIDRFAHVAYQVTPYELYVSLAERLNALTPGDSPKKTLLVTTGVEAVENAVKIARCHTRRSGIVAFAGGFHGRTSLGMALAGKSVPHKASFGPLPSPVFHVPFPSSFHGISEADALAALDELFRVGIAPSDVAAMIIEPVQGDAGFLPAPVSFLRALREMTAKQGIVLIVDEVQTGFARSGTLFAHEQAAIEADIVAMAKSLGGGYPLAAVTGKAAIMDAPVPGSLGGTYAGFPVACAAAHAVLDVIANEALCDQSVAIGARMRAVLERMATDPRLDIGEVRGLGAMLAIEFSRNRNPPEPNAGMARRVVEAAVERGLVLIPCGLHGNVIRMIVPLTASDELIDEGLSRLESSLLFAAG